MISEDQGKKLLKIARESIISEFKDSKYEASDEIKKEFNDKKGCFVTLNINGNLRGCTGYPEPIVSLYEAVIESAKNAAFNDPRFNPVSEEEFKRVKIEVTVLTKPELIKVSTPEEYLKKIQIGKHGLMVEKAYNRGLLLPQVPVEWKWNVKEFLEHTCTKAGLAADSWMDLDTNVYWFEGKVFSESE